MKRTRPTVWRNALAIAMTLGMGVLVGSVAATPAAAATPPFNATGSAKQVYVTGVAAGTEMSLVNSAGTVVATQNANSLGGLLFRNVPAATGYHVRRNSDGV